MLEAFADRLAALTRGPISEGNHEGGRARSQISDGRPVYMVKINPSQFAAPLFTQKTNKQKKWTQASLVSLQGLPPHTPQKPAASGPREGSRERESNLLQVSPEETSCVDFGTGLQSLPTNPVCFFLLLLFFSLLLPRRVGSGSRWRTEEEEEEKGGKERSGEEGGGGEEREKRKKKTAPGLEEDIVRMCTEA